ncbi:amino acid/polyamine/organocation transporter, APC superfamily [Granulicella rosea]|uniref:Amino acid/polyamine/organocation transporter, APC superfamily n=1 Tax=Granulicella rosea TaxID=474952 RepID=A0A239L9T5_9BACT|nr:APC family permease [Granulicella rosea]SNT27211.1 amino acid/polyamine/organocation transporter, APC superfamily [Granulicella rosea]
MPVHEPDHSLKRQLTLRDLVLTQILTVVGSSWVGIAGGLGEAQAVVWIVSMLVFYFPMAISVFYLNREMPLEGGLYVWARNAFGDMGGFLTAWNIWAYGLTVTATILFQIPSELSYMLGPRGAWLPENHLATFAVLALLVGALTLASVRGLALGKWIHNFSGAAMLSVFVLLILLPLWAIAHGAKLHWAPLAMHLPAMNLVNFALIGQMVGALSGLEYIAILAGESHSPERDIGRSVVIASPVICAMFILGTGSVVAFSQAHPGTSIDYIAPIPQTLRWALGNHGAGSFLAQFAILLLQLRILGAASFLLTGVTRLPMVAGWDHLIPAWFTRLHPRYRTPTNSIYISSAIIALLLVCGSLGVHAAEAFQVLNNASSELYSIAYLAMFAIPIVGAKLLRKRLPLWVAISSAIGFLATLFTFLLTAYPFVDVVNPGVYAVKILGTTVFANIVGYLFYRVRNNKDQADPPLREG